MKNVLVMIECFNWFSTPQHNLGENMILMGLLFLLTEIYESKGARSSSR